MPAKGQQVQGDNDGISLGLIIDHAPASLGSAGTARRTSTNAVVSSTEKAMPATAAARGVLIACRVSETG